MLLRCGLGRECSERVELLFDETTGKWDFRTVTWEEKFAQWKRGGPAKLPGIQRLQSEIWGDELW